VINRVVVLLVTIRNRGEVENICNEKFNLTARQTREVIEVANGLIARAAVFNRDIEVGKALIRFDDLYERSLRVLDTKTAIVAEDKRCKLLGLYDKSKAEVQFETTESELDRVRSYLEPLGVAPLGLPLVELVRLVANKCTNNMSVEYAVQGLRADETTGAGAESVVVCEGARDWDVAANRQSKAAGVGEE
jgi:hypothetical protein